MTKVPSDKLHRLIRSLSSAEKRYFSIFIRSKPDRDSKYQKLFSMLARTEVYRSERVKKKIYGSQVSEAKKYPELKAYLYDLVLKCLQSFDEQQSVEYKINHFMQSVMALYRRGHYDDCRELLQKAAKIARQHEQFARQLEIIAWEKQLAYTRMDVDYLHTRLEALNDEEQRILANLQNLSLYRRAFFGVYTTIKKEALHRSEDRLTQLRALVSGPDFEDPDRTRSQRARVLYYRALNLYHYAAQDTEAFYLTGKILIELLENQPLMLQENLSEYIAAMGNFILACGLQQHYSEVRQSLQKLRALKPITEDDRRKIHQLYYTNRFALCQYTGEFEEGRAEMIRCEQEAARLNANGYKPPNFSLLYCSICFGCADYDAALGHLNHWLAQPRTVAREDLQSLARILALILHFELGNFVLLDSLLRSAERFMKQKNRFHELEKRFLLLMRDLTRAANAKERIPIFQKIKEEWADLPGAKAIEQTFDLESWLESKISNQSFAAIVRRKWQGD
jgi:hypothetical protein